MPTRRELFEKTGACEPEGPRLHKRTIKAFTDLARERMQEGWFRSSFWGGAFPATEKPCGREAMYRLMNAPEEKAAKPLLVATAWMGKAAEDLLCEQWAAAGMSLVHREGGLPLDEQLRLKDEEHWMSTAIDEVLDLRPDWGAVTPVDVKSKKESVIDDMRAGDMGCDPVHRAQVIGYCHVCRLHHEDQGWDKLGLRKCEGGFVYYVSRNNPSHAVEYWIPYDEAEVEAALDLLKEWSASFEAGVLPPRDPGWKWTEQPCKYCDFKPRCKKDYQGGVEKLADSAVVDHALLLDPEYDFSEVQVKVLNRWK